MMVEEKVFAPYPPAAMPTTVEELARIVGGRSTHEDAHGYGMFWCMRGVPRSYMEMSEVVSGVVVTLRCVYVVIGFESQEPRELAEPKLVEAMYKFLTQCRQSALTASNVIDTPNDPPMPPVLFVRRSLELQPYFDEEKVRLTFRIYIPGVDLAEHDIYRIPNRVTYVQVD